MLGRMHAQGQVGATSPTSLFKGHTASTIPSIVKYAPASKNKGLMKTVLFDISARALPADERLSGVAALIAPMQAALGCVFGEDFSDAQARAAPRSQVATTLSSTLHVRPRGVRAGRRLRAAPQPKAACIRGSVGKGPGLQPLGPCAALRSPPPLLPHPNPQHDTRKYRARLIIRFMISAEIAGGSGGFMRLEFGSEVRGRRPY